MYFLGVLSSQGHLLSQSYAQCVYVSVCVRAYICVCFVYVPHLKQELWQEGFCFPPKMIFFT